VPGREDDLATSDPNQSRQAAHDTLAGMQQTGIQLSTDEERNLAWLRQKIGR
jgi:hypothetical protein